jgi:hypothetical protein
MKEDVRCHALSFLLLQSGRRALCFALMRFSPTYCEERFTC